jgi:hypothetical protein
VIIDGQKVSVRGGPAFTFEKTGSKWTTAKAKPGKLRKTHALQGPIDDAFLDPFLLVRPTGTPWNEAANRHALGRLAHFDRIWAMNYRGHPRVKNDKDVTKEDFARYNVVLFGDPGSNAWIGKMAKNLPLQWSKDGFTIAGRKYSSGESLPVLVYPNPLNASKYVVLNTGLTITDQEYNADYAMPRFGDIAVLKIGSPDAPAEILWADLFNESWRLPEPSH